MDSAVFDGVKIGSTVPAAFVVSSASGSNFSDCGSCSASIFIAFAAPSVKV
jgi:hypothetical protein